MKWNLAQFFIACTLLLSFTFSAQAAETYTLDPQHTYVLYHISHLGFSTQSGKWFAQGSLVLDEAKPQNSKVNVSIQLASIDTGIKELDDHLKEKLFFNVAQFPKATFVSDKVEVTGKKTGKVHGILTLHGVSKPVTLDTKFNNTGVNPITGKKTIGFSATTNIKRSDFGINTLLPEVGDDVKIDIAAEAYKAN